VKDPKRRWLLKKLDHYEPFDEGEATMVARLLSFVLAHERCCDRRLEGGHVVVGAWVLDQRREQVLLLRHRKLGKWLQPGGHIERDESLIDAARRELTEESGLRKFRLLSGEVFDFNVHTIPARAGEAEHIHYDVRFVFEASSSAKLQVSDESHELRWVNLAKVLRLNDSSSMKRMIAKTRRLPR
jgi:8-oxo-dGTP pyrophosphatase MutT (NUDIX family)